MGVIGVRDYINIYILYIIYIGEGVNDKSRCVRWWDSGMGGY